MHRLSIFNANAKFYVLMGTVAEIKKDDRCVEIENFLEQSGDEWILKLLVREPVKLTVTVIEDEEMVKEEENKTVEEDEGEEEFDHLRRTKER